jgi:hypothetical protein
MIRREPRQKPTWNGRSRDDSAGTEAETYLEREEPATVTGTVRRSVQR